MTPTNKNPHEKHRSRVRTRVTEYGAATLCDHELLELLLYYAIPRRDTNTLAHTLLDRFGSLDKLFGASVPELTQVPGVGEYTAVLIAAVFECCKRLNRGSSAGRTFHTFEQIGDYLLTLYAGCETEKLTLLLFDKKGRIDRTVVISEGTAELAPVKTKKIVGCAVSTSAVSAALAHNHPSGALAPSYEDKSVTVEVDDLLCSLNIRLIDHYIIADGRYIGVKRHGYGMAVCTEAGAGELLSEEKL